MKQILFSATLLIALFLVSACATIEPIEPTFKDPKRIFDKNYKINQMQRANVGEEIIKVKDYWVQPILHEKIKTLNDFEIETELSGKVYTGTKGETFEIIGTTTTRRDEQYFAFRLPDRPHLNLFITEDGKWRQSQMPIIIPEDTEFEFVEETEIDQSKTFINYEIVFTGITANSMNFLYREYTAEDLARPAFHQNLTYPINTEIIRFRQTRIKIHEVSSESIKYTVLEDGLSE